MLTNFRPGSGNKSTNSYEVGFQLDKENKDVVKDIERLSVTEEFRKSNFILSELEIIQPDDIFRYESYYKISRDGYIRLIMDYSDSISNHLKEKFLLQFTQNEQILIDNMRKSRKNKKK